MGELSMIIESDSSLSNRLKSLTKIPLKKVQCSQKSQYAQNQSLSKKSRTGSAYFDNEAV